MHNHILLLLYWTLLQICLPFWWQRPHTTRYHWLPRKRYWNYLDPLYTISQLYNIISVNFKWIFIPFIWAIKVIHLTTFNSNSCKWRKSATFDYQISYREWVLMYAGACMCIDQGWANYGLRLSLDQPICQNVKFTCFHFFLFSLD